MWFDILKSLRRYVLSNSDKINKKETPVGTGSKPEGLWYSFSLGQGWLKFMQEEKHYNLQGKMDEYKYILELDTSSVNILKINTKKKLDSFIKIYKINPLDDMDVKFWWPLVSQNYDGIEFSNGMYAKHDTIRRNWSMDSGCIWDTTSLKIKKVKPLEERQKTYVKPSMREYYKMREEEMKRREED